MRRKAVKSIKLNFEKAPSLLVLFFLLNVYLNFKLENLTIRHKKCILYYQFIHQREKIEFLIL
jgi:hypothetical protein